MAVDKFVKYLDRNIKWFCIIFLGISIYYIYINDIFNFGDKFTNVLIGLLTFVGLFYTVMIVSRFIKRINEFRKYEIKKLKNHIKNITKKELSSLTKENYDECTNLCDKKITIYNDLLNLKNRTINKALFVSVLTLIILLIIDSNFIPSTIKYIGDYKPLVLLTGLFYVIYNLIIIVIQFFRIFND